MASRQTNRQTGTTGQTNHQTGHGVGLGAPGTTGAAGAYDPLGAPGTTGADMTTPGAPGTGYDPTEYGTTGGAQAQLHRPGAGTDVGTGQGHTYGTAGSMGPTDTNTGYHAGVYVPHTTGITGTYDTSVYTTTVTGGDAGDFGRSGGAGGDRGGYGVGDMRAHGYGGERGGHHGRTTGEEMADLLSTGVGGGGVGGDGGKHGDYDTGKMHDQSHSAGGDKGGYDFGGARKKEGRHLG